MSYPKTLSNTDAEALTFIPGAVVVTDFAAGEQGHPVVVGRHVVFAPAEPTPEAVNNPHLMSGA